MVGNYPVYQNGEQSSASSRVVWFGDESERVMCKYCQTSKLNRNGRYYTCPTCNQRFPVSDQLEELKVDFNVSKLDIKPALVFQDKMDPDDLRGIVRDELKEKYHIKEPSDTFDGVPRRAGVRIIGEYDHHQ